MNRPVATARQTTSRKCRRLHPEPESLEGRMLLSAGDLDPTFSGDGFTLVAPAGGSKNKYADARAVEIRTDGKILVGGYDNGNFGLVRINPNGSLDSSFGSGGRAATTAGVAEDMALQPDGKIVLIGHLLTQPKGGVSDRDLAVARFNANGTLDTSFGSGGKVVTPVSTVSSPAPGANKADYAGAGVIQPFDQKILVGGGTYVGGDEFYRSVLVRYNTNGSLDNSFGQGGKLVFSANVGESGVEDIAVLSDHRILAAGFGRDAAGRSALYVARFNEDGTPDETFGSGGDGVVLTAIGATGHTRATSLAVLADGKILVSGYNGASPNLDLMLARYTPDGALDSTFGTGTGYVVVDKGGSEYARGMAVQPDGKIIVAGQTTLPGGTTALDSFIARFAADGTPDPSFGVSGIVIAAFSNATDSFDSLALQADGKAVAVGISRTEASRSVTDNFLVARFQGDSFAPLSTSTAVIGGNSTGRAAAKGQPEILLPLTEADMTDLATAVLLSRPKRRGAIMF